MDGKRKGRAWGVTSASLEGPRLPRAAAKCGRTLPALHRGWRPRLLLWRPAVATASASGAERSHAV